MDNYFVMQNYLKVITIPLILFSFGCVPTSFEQRVKRLESSLNDIRSVQSEIMSQVSEVQDQVRQLSGKTEELQYSANQKYGTDLDRLREDLSSLKRRVPPPANVPVLPLEEDELAAQKASLTTFVDALTKLRTGNYTDALVDLEQVKANASSDVYPHALFWIGVTYDGLTEYKNALITYNELVQKFPKHRRAPLTLLRQASVFEKLGDATASDATLKKLVNDYPNSPEAAAISSKLKTTSNTKSAPTAQSKQKKTSK
jgi:TolA-binding protein